MVVGFDLCVCIYIYIRVCVCVCVYMCVYICVCIYACVRCARVGEFAPYVQRGRGVEGGSGGLGG